MSQEGKTVSGYKNAVFSGLTTLALSEIITEIIIDYPRSPAYTKWHPSRSASMIS